MIIISFLSINIQSYWYDSNIDKTMNKFYTKLDRSIPDINKKIEKLESIQKKINVIKRNRWNKLDNKSKTLIINLDNSLSNKIYFYKKELENQKESIDLSDLLGDIDTDIDYDNDDNSNDNFETNITFTGIKWNRIQTNLPHRTRLDSYHITPEYTNDGLYNNFIDKYLRTSNKRSLWEWVYVLTNQSEINNLLKDLNSVNSTQYDRSLKEKNNVIYFYINNSIFSGTNHLNLNTNLEKVITEKNIFIENSIVDLDKITQQAITYRIMVSPDRKELLVYKDKYDIRPVFPKEPSQTFTGIKWNRIITKLNSNVYLKEYNITPEYTRNWLYNNFIDSFVQKSEKRSLWEGVTILTDKNEIREFMSIIKDLDMNSNHPDRLVEKDNIYYYFYAWREKSSSIYLNNNKYWVNISIYDPFIKNNIVDFSTMTSQRTTYRIIESPDKSELMIYKDTYSIREK